MENENEMDQEMMAQLDSYVQLRKWVNFSIDEEFLGITELYSGLIYCLLVNKIFRDVVNLQELIPGTDEEDEIRGNFKILQESIEELQIPLSVPIDDLARQDFDVHIKFIAEFYDVFRFFSPFYVSYA